jgi:hypothetical protein
VLEKNLACQWGEIGHGASLQNTPGVQPRQETIKTIENTKRIISEQGVV